MTSTVPEYAGCPWPLDPACLSTSWENLDADVQARATALASATLHRLTGYRVGGCPITVRPCKASCAGDARGYDTNIRWMYPHIGHDGVWINSCGCSTDCSCDALCEVVLPEPVGEVYAVTVGSTVLTPDQYRVDGSTLVWTGAGECPWPTCQNLTAPVGDPDTFAVEYLNSHPVDGMGAYAAAVLAMEYAKACMGDNKCRLPSGVTTVARMGVVYEVAAGAFPGGFTGIREVDVFIGMWNPEPIRQRATVWTPDLHSPRVMR